MDAAPAGSLPPPRTRPRHRRAEIARNAGELFSVRGFHAVRMDDIAEASGITARALYRHYDNKQALLAHVVREDQQHVIDVITELGDRPPGQDDVDARLVALTGAALDSRRLSLLWQREARHLAVDDFRLVRRRTRWIAEQLEELVVRATRGDLDRETADIRSWVTVSIISGPGFYDSALPHPRLTQELAEAGKRVIAAPMVTAPVAAAPHEADREPNARREQLLHVAAREFRAKGFAGVSIDDIGAGLGIVGPALYRYFDTKADILVAAVSRFHEWLALEADRAMRTPCPDEEVLGLLIEGYVRVAREATDLLAVWLTERLYLPDAARERIDRIQADHVLEWQRWLSVARPDLSDALAATLVRTAKTLVDDCVRIPHLRRYPVLTAELACAARAVLGLPQA